jgi:hypothetical protein
MQNPIAGNSQATVVFRAPYNDNGSPIISYTARIYLSNGTVAFPDITVNAADVPGVDKSIVFTGLSNGTQYRFTVRARNAVGQSVLGDYSKYVIPVN